MDNFNAAAQLLYIQSRLSFSGAKQQRLKANGIS